MAVNAQKTKKNKKHTLGYPRTLNMKWLLRGKNQIRLGDPGNSTYCVQSLIINNNHGHNFSENIMLQTST